MCGPENLQVLLDWVRFLACDRELPIVVRAMMPWGTAAPIAVDGACVRVRVRVRVGKNRQACVRVRPKP